MHISLSVSSSLSSFIFYLLYFIVCAALFIFIVFIAMDSLYVSLFVVEKGTFEAECTSEVTGLVP